MDFFVIVNISSWNIMLITNENFVHLILNIILYPTAIINDYYVVLKAKMHLK